jgi:predicted transcriptional regulator
MNLEMKVKEIMKKGPVVVAPNDSLATVLKMANKETDLAVVKEGETVKGLVTSNDIYHAMRSYIIGKICLNPFQWRSEISR